MRGIKNLDKAEGEVRRKREFCSYEFMKHLRFYETFYFDVHSKKFFTADNYEEILKRLKSVTEENREYFYDI